MDGPSLLLWATVRIHRDGLADALRRDPRIGDVAVTADGRGCVETARRLRPSVVAIDATTSDAVAVAGTLRDERVGVIAFGIADRAADVVGLAEAGVSAYLTQDQPLDDLVAAVVTVSRGGTRCSPKATAMLLRYVAESARRRRQVEREVPDVNLTRRQREILALVSRGLSNKEIGLELSIEVATVKNHVHHILEKVGATSRSQAVAMMQARGAAAGGAGAAGVAGLGVAGVAGVAGLAGAGFGATSEFAHA